MALLDINLWMAVQKKAKMTKLLMDAKKGQENFYFKLVAGRYLYNI